MNTLCRNLIAIQMQEDFEKIVADMEIVREGILMAACSGRDDDANFLMRRSGFLCAELTNLTYHLERGTVKA